MTKSHQRKTIARRQIRAKPEARNADVRTGLAPRFPRPKARLDHWLGSAGLGVVETIEAAATGSHSAVVVAVGHEDPGRIPARIDRWLVALSLALIVALIVA